jgi:glutathione S-transferase
MLKLYGSGRSRWIRPLWLLRELDVPFEAVTVDRQAGELDTPAFRALSPTGKIPVLVEDGQPICESGAILLHLADRYPDRRLLPPPGTLARGVHDQWLFTITTELEPPIWLLHRQRSHGEGGEPVAALALEKIAVAMAPLEARLAGQPFLTGSEFAVADIPLTHLLTWAVMQPILPDYPALTDYRDRLMARPAFPDWLYA